MATGAESDGCVSAPSRTAKTRLPLSGSCFLLRSGGLGVHLCMYQNATTQW